jgi:hypothetical protein
MRLIKQWFGFGALSCAVCVVSCGQPLTLQLPNEVAADASDAGAPLDGGAEVELLGTLPDVFALAPADGELYVTSFKGAVARWKPTEGLRIFNRYETNALGLFVDASRVYVGVGPTDRREFASASVVAFKRADLAAPPAVLASAFLPEQIIGSGRFLWVADTASDGLLQVNIDAKLQRVWESRGAAHAVGTTRTGLVWSNYQEGYLRYADSPEGTWRELYRWPAKSVRELKTFEDRIVVAVEQSPGTKLFALDTPDAQPKMVVNAVQRIYGFAINLSHVYYVVSGSWLYRAPLSGGTPELLSVNKAGSGEGTGAVALDESYVYWATSAGALLRLRIK